MNIPGKNGKFEKKQVFPAKSALNGKLKAGESTSAMLKPKFQEIVRRPQGIHTNPFLNKDGTKKPKAVLQK